MMKSGSESWQVTTYPIPELNFVVYLACAFGLCGEQPQGSMACWPEPLFEAPAARTVKPFRLHIDVVCTGLTERLELVTDTLSHRSTAFGGPRSCWLCLC